MCDHLESVPDEIRFEVENVASLPEKSGDKYIQAYQQFMDWKEAQNIDKNDFSETVLLLYFSNLQRKYIHSHCIIYIVKSILTANYKSSTLWVIYSMLKTTIDRNNSVNINYTNLTKFLKKCSEGYVARKSSPFKSEDIDRFLREAADKEHLVAKVSDRSCCFLLEVILFIFVFV